MTIIYTALFVLNCRQCVCWCSCPAHLLVCLISDRSPHQTRRLRRRRRPFFDKMSPTASIYVFSGNDDDGRPTLSTLLICFAGPFSVYNRERNSPRYAQLLYQNVSAILAGRRPQMELIIRYKTNVASFFLCYCCWLDLTSFEYIYILNTAICQQSMSSGSIMTFKNFLFRFCY